MKTKRLNSGDVIPPDYFGQLWDDVRACELSGDGNTVRVDRSPGGTSVSAVLPAQVFPGGGFPEIIVPAFNLGSTLLTKGRAVVLSYDKRGRFIINSNAPYQSGFFLGVLISDCPAAENGKPAPLAMVMVQGCTTARCNIPYVDWYCRERPLAVLPDGTVTMAPRSSMVAGIFAASIVGVMEIPVILTFCPLDVPTDDFTWYPAANGIHFRGGYVGNFGSVAGKSFNWTELVSSGNQNGIWLCFKRNSSNWELENFGNYINSDFCIQLTEELRQKVSGMLIIPPFAEQ